jgi:hypothetical protein
VSSAGAFAICWASLGEYGSLTALGETLTRSVLRGAGGGVAAGADVPVVSGAAADAGRDSIVPAPRNGDVTTPSAGSAPATTPGAVRRGSPGAANCSTWPTRIRFGLSMAFQTASSR